MMVAGACIFGLYNADTGRMMGKDELKERDTWQDTGGHRAAGAEHSFFRTFQKAFKKTQFKIAARPQDLNRIYVDIPLSKGTISEIFNPQDPIKMHGIMPDYVISNSDTGKILYVEVKRQDGWVEGKTRKAGRGNAHERCCKYFTPGLLKIGTVRNFVCKPFIGRLV